MERNAKNAQKNESLGKALNQSQKDNNILGADDKKPLVKPLKSNDANLISLKPMSTNQPPSNNIILP